MPRGTPALPASGPNKAIRSPSFNAARALPPLASAQRLRGPNRLISGAPLATTPQARNPRPRKLRSPSLPGPPATTHPPAPWEAVRSSRSASTSNTCRERRHAVVLLRHGERQPEHWEQCSQKSGPRPFRRLSGTPSEKWLQRTTTTHRQPAHTVRARPAVFLLTEKLSHLTLRPELS